MHNSVQADGLQMYEAGAGINQPISKLDDVTRPQCIPSQLNSLLTHQYTMAATASFAFLSLVDLGDTLARPLLPSILSTSLQVEAKDVEKCCAMTPGARTH